jgi:hypothetical protein
MIIDIIGLIIWIIMAIWAGVCIAAGVMISPWAYLSAAIICVLFYIESILRKFIE